MAALARLAKGEARSAVEYFCAVAQKASRLPKPAFQAAVDDEIRPDLQRDRSRDSWRFPEAQVHGGSRTLAGSCRWPGAFRHS